MGRCVLPARRVGRPARWRDSQRDEEREREVEREKLPPNLIIKNGSAQHAVSESLNSTTSNGAPFVEVVLFYHTLA